MDISVFEAVGPVMIGPSSSHTAGAARLARIARTIVAGSFDHVSFGMHGSFAQTYRGHGTDRALVAGVLGFPEDDERISNAFALGEQAGLTWDFHPIELLNVHENSVKMTFFMKDGSRQEIIGSSVGGGQIIICEINGFLTDISAQSSTLVISQNDRRGVISDVSRVLAEVGMNIGTMKVSRHARGETAFCIIETDASIDDAVVARLKQVNNVLSVQAINLSEGEAF
ncbi:L-serine ammonia-lyase, iron-sulfur-dependent subunit beta [Oscillospiraceae bacterium LTW-04]|nr:L-serine ammonia-lyase, iron-sulfur-dependent subunit beta [Oscillospiraceae bacterium MB24-C1]